MGSMQRLTVKVFVNLPVYNVPGGPIIILYWGARGPRGPRGPGAQDKSYTGPPGPRILPYWAL